MHARHCESVSILNVSLPAGAPKGVENAVTGTGAAEQPEECSGMPEGTELRKLNHLQPISLPASPLVVPAGQQQQRTPSGRLPSNGLPHHAHFEARRSQPVFRADST